MYRDEAHVRGTLATLRHASWQHTTRLDPPVCPLLGLACLPIRRSAPPDASLGGPSSDGVIKISVGRESVCRKLVRNRGDVFGGGTVWQLVQYNGVVTSEV